MGLLKVAERKLDEMWIQFFSTELVPFAMEGLQSTSVHYPDVNNHFPPDITCQGVCRIAHRHGLDASDIGGEWSSTPSIRFGWGPLPTQLEDGYAEDRDSDLFEHSLGDATLRGRDEWWSKFLTKELLPIAEGGLTRATFTF